MDILLNSEVCMARVGPCQMALASGLKINPLHCMYPPPPPKIMFIIIIEVHFWTIHDWKYNIFLVQQFSFSINLKTFPTKCSSSTVTYLLFNWLIFLKINMRPGPAITILIFLTLTLSILILPLNEPLLPLFKWIKLEMREKGLGMSMRQGNWLTVVLDANQPLLHLFLDYNDILVSLGLWLSCYICPEDLLTVLSKVYSSDIDIVVEGLHILPQKKASARQCGAMQRGMHTHLAYLLRAINLLFQRTHIRLALRCNGWN